MFNPNENRFGDPPEQPPRRAASPMALAAVSCAILGIMTVYTGIISLAIGSLAVLFAFLSQGNRPQPERPARYAFRVGIIAIIVSIVLMIASFAIVIFQYGSLKNFYNSYLYTLEQQYSNEGTIPLPETGGDAEAL